jgi:hypothetical protein
MTTASLKYQLQAEIDLIPEDKLADVYNFIHYFRLGAEKTQPSRKEKTLSFAGCWKDMDNQLFADLTNEIATRRTTAFSHRRNHESGVD